MLDLFFAFLSVKFIHIKVAQNFCSHLVVFKSSDAKVIMVIDADHRCSGLVT